jgi:polysaccharide deacetylase 2 family uncharacterized protein YibQ
MSSKEGRTKRKGFKGRKRHHILLILLLVVIGTFFIYREFSKEDIRPRVPKRVQPKEKHDGIARVAILIDDLGPNKNAAISVFSINAPLTLSIFPQETYTAWIADEGYKRGYEIIGHIPMEAKEPHALGKGGLYIWMTDSEIRETLKEDINSIPHIKGVSSHMGSAFTEDERAMHILLSVLKERRFFFLDSFTTPKSIGVKLANERGVKALTRDIFLDNEDNAEYIERQWEKAVKIAKKKGYAIILAHPRKNTVEFLKKTLSNNEVKVVPLSELVTSQ